MLGNDRVTSIPIESQEDISSHSLCKSGLPTGGRGHGHHRQQGLAQILLPLSVLGLAYEKCLPGVPVRRRLLSGEFQWLLVYEIGAIGTQGSCL